AEHRTPHALWLYDELDVDADVVFSPKRHILEKAAAVSAPGVGKGEWKPVFLHSILLSNGWEIRLRFHRLAATRMKSLLRPGTPPSAPPKRFAALFMGNGVNPKHWWAKGSGADMQLSKSLEPLAPLRPRLNVVSGLFNKAATGVGIHPGQTGNILSGAALQKGTVLRGGVSMDEVLAAHLGQETAQPSLVLGC